MSVVEGIEKNCGHEGELENPRPWGEATSARAREGFITALCPKDAAR